MFTLLVNEQLAPAEGWGKLLPLVQEQLRPLAQQVLRGERTGHTLQPTALVHEAFLRLVGPKQLPW